MEKSQYEKLKNQKLPKYEVLVDEYGIDSIGKEENIQREIIRKIHDKVNFYSGQMESLVQPDSSISSMREASALTPLERQLVSKIFNKTMFIIREVSEFFLDYSDDAASDFIVHIHSEWLELKPEVKKIMGKLKETWSNETKSTEERGYFG